MGKNPITGKAKSLILAPRLEREAPTTNVGGETAEYLLLATEAESALLTEEVRSNRVEVHCSLALNKWTKTEVAIE